MKLSEIRGERTFDVIADIIEPVANIAADKEASALFNREKAPEGADPREFALEKFKKSMPALMRGHKRDIIAIMAALDGTTAEEYCEGLTLSSLVLDVLELVNDEEFAAFLS